jgi:hypothetical protein
MASWNSLPNEIRNHILYFFCLNVIEEYKEFHFDFNDEDDDEEEDNASTEIVWPKPPECLSSFASALGTCRFFHDVITQIIKVDGEHVVEILQELQFDKLVRIQIALHGCPKPHLDLYFSTVGYFWRNPKLSKDPDIIGSFKLWDDAKSPLMLIPHLEDWLKHNTPSKSKQSQKIQLTLSEMEGNAELVLLTDSDSRFTSAGCDTLEICPITKFHKILGGKSPKIAPRHRLKLLPIVQDVTNSSTDSWWLFRRIKHQWDGSMICKWWCLVNYETKQMHMRPQYASRITFENAWNPSRDMAEKSPVAAKPQVMAMSKSLQEWVGKSWLERAGNSWLTTLANRHLQS